MIATDEEALICDFAQQYHVTNMWELLPETAAVLAKGLDRDSRIMRKMAGSDQTLQEMLLAAGVDALNLILWTKTKDAEKGRNRPKSVLMEMTKEAEEKKDNGILAFDTPEEWMKAYKEAREKINGN